MAKKAISALRISEKLNDNMLAALAKLNESQIKPLSLNDFRRLCYEYLSQLVLQNKRLPFKLQM